MRIQNKLNTVSIDFEKCVVCGKCITVCPKNIFSKDDKNNTILVGNTSNCIGCLSCVNSCPENAITVENRNFKKFFIARRCNNSCIMCFEHDVNLNEEYSFEEIISDMSSQIKGTEEMIILSGAEITTRHDLFKILKHIRKLNKTAKIFLPTNGRMFSYEKYLHKFLNMNLGNVKITISILGSNEKTHDKITRVKNSFRQAVKGIDNLLKFNQEVHVNVTILKDNFKEIPDIAKMFLEKGVRTIQLALVEPNGRASNNFKNFIPKMSNAIPYITEALKIGNGNVRTKNIPFCFLGKYRMYHFFETSNYQKTKSINCNQCIYNKECFGIWKEYVDIYGYEELKPISKDKIETLKINYNNIK